MVISEPTEHYWLRIPSPLLCRELGITAPTALHSPPPWLSALVFGFRPPWFTRFEAIAGASSR